MSIEEHNNLMNEVNTLKLSVQRLEQQLNIKNDNDIQICKITEDEILKLITNNKLTLEKVKQWNLQNGDLMIKAKYGKTILHSASYKGQLDILEYVLDNGIDVDSLNDDKQTPLIFASCDGHVEVINILLERGANINHQNNIGWSALHYACSWNQLEPVKLLVENDIDIYLKDDNNKTALDVANYHSHQEIINYFKSVIKE